jgi:HAD superfamily hydrolase (TIGR01509 family)
MSPAAGARAAAVLFDMDGLLVDSEPLWTVAEVELATRLGGSWSDELKSAIVGMRLDLAVPTILEWYDVDRSADAVAGATAFLLERMVELFHEALPLHEGALELVDGVRSRGVPTALVSSSFRVLVEAALDVLGRHRFDFTLAGDEVTCGKPDPEPYVAACASLGVAPSDAVVLEDAMTGVTSAEAAGCFVVAVPFVAPIPATSRRPVIASLADIDVDWLLAVPASLAADGLEHIEP